MSTIRPAFRPLEQNSMTYIGWKLGVLIFACVLLLASSTFGQGSGAKLDGTVRDSQGRIVPGAMVIATNEATGVARESYTNDAGIFVFSSLLPGKYAVSAEVKGFKKAEVTGFVLEVATSKTLDFKLVVGGSTETVTVTSDSIQQIQLASSDLGDIVVEKKIKDMPLNGRVPIELVFTQPGLAGNNRQGNNASSYGGLSVNGARPQANALAMDGVDITSSELGTGGAGINIATDILLPVDAIEEFRVITANPTAQYGRVSGFQVQISTKSGTNHLHGNIYDFYRGTVLNANLFFNNAAATPIARLPLLRNQFGASLGGPVVIPKLYNGRNHAFFFFNYEGTRESSGVSRTRTVLTKEARNGLFRFITPNVTKNPDTGAALTRNSGVVVDNNGQIRAGVQGIQTVDLINTDLQSFDGIGADKTGIVKKMVDATSLPNDFISAGDGLNTAAFKWSPSGKAANDLYTYKFDYAFNKHNLSFRGNYGRVDRIDSTNDRYPPYPGGYARWRYENQMGYALNVTSSLKPTLTHEAHIGLSRNVREFPSTVDGGTLNIGPGLFTQPYPAFEYQIVPRQTLTIGDSATWIKGRHVFKGGFEFRSTPMNNLLSSRAILVGYSTAYAQISSTTLFPTSTYTISSQDAPNGQSLFNQLMGRIGSASASFNAISDNAFGGLDALKDRGFRERDWGGYFQDDWKVNNKLTLNLGLRYDFFQVPWEVNSMFSVPQNRSMLATQLNPSLPYTPVAFSRVGPKYGTQFWNDDMNNFGPAVGFSWDPKGNNKTAIRGSYRISYDKVFYSYTMNLIEPTVPGLNYSSLVTATQLQTSYPLTNTSGQARTLRLADLLSTPTQIGVNVGNGAINLGSAVDIRSTKKPLSLVSDTRGTSYPVDFDPNVVNPYSQSWSVGIQREIMRNTIVEIRYVGRKGTHEVGGVSANQYRAPADVLNGLRTLQGILKMTNQDAFAKAGSALPNGVSPTALVTIAQLYGSNNPTDISQIQYASGNLSSLRPQSQILNNLLLATSTTSANSVQLSLNNNNLPQIMQLLDYTATLRANTFLTSVGLQPVPSGTSASGWLPQAVGLANNAFLPNIQFGSNSINGLGPTTIETDFNSNYAGLQVQFSRRFYKGFELQANYTLSRNRDVTSTSIPMYTSNVTDFFNRSADYGISNNDATHDLKVNGMFELPFGVGKRFASSHKGFISQLVGGWQVSSIFEYASAFPNSLSYSGQSTSFGGGNRPDLVSGANLDSIKNIGKMGRDSQGNVIYYTQDNLNTFKATFQSAQLGTVGNLPKNSFRGPKYWDVTMAVLKNFRITETSSVQLRGEFFNLFNHVNFSDPNFALDSGTFGRITTQRNDPRLIQLALKVNF
jgi:hypothetical protein